MPLYNSGFERLPHGEYFSTDPVVADSLAWALKKAGLDLDNLTCWEPCAGAGHLMRGLERHGVRVGGTELHQYVDQDPRIRTGVDVMKMLTTILGSNVDLIATNPDFAHPSCENLIAHILRFAPTQWCAFLVPINWLAAKGKRRRDLINGGRCYAISCMPRRALWMKANKDGEHKGSPKGDHVWLLFAPLDHPGLRDAPRFWKPPGEELVVKLTPEAREKSRQRQAQRKADQQRIAEEENARAREVGTG